MGNCVQPNKVHFVEAKIIKMETLEEQNAKNGQSWLFKVETDQDGPKHLDHKPNISGMLQLSFY